jgi:hypothetical protein
VKPGKARLAWAAISVNMGRLRERNLVWHKKDIVKPNRSVHEFVEI